MLWQNEAEKISLYSDNCKGWKLPEILPLNMTKIYGVSFCARRGGSTFLDTVRVDPQVNSCPGDLKPCTQDTRATETTCVSDLADCPILDIMVVS